MYVAFPHLLLLFHCYLNAIWNICELTGSLGFRFDVSTKNKKICNLLAITLLNLVSQLSFRQTNKQTKILIPDRFALLFTIPVKVNGRTETASIMSGRFLVKFAKVMRFSGLWSSNVSYNSRSVLDALWEL